MLRITTHHQDTKSLDRKASMSAPAAQQTLFKDLAADLPDQHQAEFFQNLHEAGISPNDVELARLLRALQLYKQRTSRLHRAATDLRWSAGHSFHDGERAACP